METDESVEIVIAGFALLVAQSYVVTNPFFGEEEIRKYIRMRERFHEPFVEACINLAGEMDEDQVLRTELLAASRVPKQQTHRALIHLVRALKKIDWRTMGVSRHTGRLLAYANDVARDDDYGHNRRSLFSTVLRAESVPSGLKTFLRQINKLPASHIQADELADPGAWFTMPLDQRVALRTALDETEQQIKEAMQSNDHDLVKSLVRKTMEIQAEAGVPARLIKREDTMSVSDLLKQERKLEADGPTAYLIASLADDLEDFSQHDIYGVSSAEVLAVSKNLRKCKKLDTAQRVIREAIGRRLLSNSWQDQIEELTLRLQRNLCVKRGTPIQPLTWEPVSTEDFIARHGLQWDGVVFNHDTTPEQQANVLGKVSRAITDLERVFGPGLCTMHAKPIQFRFDGAGFGAMASYFMWKNNNFQPHVSFGDKFDGLLAHELSHFVDDALGKKLRGMDKGGTLFVNTGVPLEYIVKTADRRPDLPPEVLEFAQAVTATPDYARWSDYLSGAYQNVMATAIQEYTGQDAYSTEQGRTWLDATYKSELPPELVALAEKIYLRGSGGDSRKLTYTQSGVEVWARMCEQYVYTKLAELGISNPWLTQLDYEDSNFMDQDRFEQQVAPIIERLLAKARQDS